MGKYILVLVTFISAVFTSNPPKVTICQGSLVGTTITTRGGREVYGFLGIPYAAPPTGRLRFKSPQEPPTWPGLRDASRPGSVCIQLFVLIEKLRNITTGSEDCLFLNVYTPAISQSGTALCPWAFSSTARHRQLAAQLARLTGCPALPSQQLLDCLLTLPAQDIVGTLKHFIVWDMDPVAIFNPAIEPEDVEDAFLTSDPWSLTSQIPWMIGFNENEGALKLASLTQGNVPEKFKKFNEEFDEILPMSLLYQHTARNAEKVTEAIRQFYFGKTEKITLSMIPELIKLYTDAWFVHGSSEAARRHDGPLFFYHFTYNHSDSISLCNYYFSNNCQFFGVGHFDELMYLFPMDNHAPRLIKNNSDFKMSTKMIQLWTNYAVKRIPVLDDSEDFWKTKDGSKEEYLEISANGFCLKKHLLMERVEFWKTLPLKETC